MNPYVLEYLPYHQDSFAHAFAALKTDAAVFAWETRSKGAAQSVEMRSHKTEMLSVLGIARKTISFRNMKVSIREARLQNPPSHSLSPCPFSLLEGLLDALDSAESPEYNTLPILHGIFGFIGYDSGRFLEKVRGMEANSDYPDAWFIIPSALAVFDHQAEIAYVVRPTDAPETDYARLQDAVMAGQTNEKTNRASLQIQAIETNSKLTAEEFAQIVLRAKQYIRDGDCFQIVLSNSFRTLQQIDPISAYLELRKNNPSPYHFYIPFDDKVLIGASPETMLKSWKTDEGTVVSMRPVAGTYPAQSLQSTESVEVALSRDPKEHAEHVMLVDHVRSDLGRTAQPAAVSVEQLLLVETYEHLHHLVSDVRAVLKPELSPVAALRGAFPIATLTGTPKIRAMEIIAELENAPRGIFGGTVLAINQQQMIDSAVVIRSMIVSADEVHYQAGAGIVIDSIPEREHNECLLKARSQQQVIQAAIRR